jgi:hypothetical protein
VLVKMKPDWRWHPYRLAFVEVSRGD